MESAFILQRKYLVSSRRIYSWFPIEDELYSPAVLSQPSSGISTWQQATDSLFEQFDYFWFLYDKWRSLHEQFVHPRWNYWFSPPAISSWYFMGIFEKTASGSLHGQLVCYQHFLKTASGGLFMSSLYGKRQVAASSWAACTLVFLEDSKWQLIYLSNLCVIVPLKTASGSFFMSNLWVFGNKWRTLHEQLVCFNILWRQQVAVSSWAACMLLTPLKGSKWRPLYLSSLCIPNNNVYSANGIPSEKSRGEVCYFILFKRYLG